MVNRMSDISAIKRDADQGGRFGPVKRSDLSIILRKLNGFLPFRDREDLASFVNWQGNAASPIHRWLRYREAYSPHLISKLALGDRILDPFCGRGSILLGAAQSGYTSAGIDVNPLAVFAARVKLTPLSKVQLRSVTTYGDELPGLITDAKPWPMPALNIADKVFEPEILDTLLRIRALYESAFSGDQGGRDFFAPGLGRHP